jgi:succinate dehydrogenase / fumarate reductase flavoprotein subunit
MHGANRLGGNSLSDLLVFGKRAGEHAAIYAKNLTKAPEINNSQLEEAMRQALAPFEDNGDENPYTVHQDLQTCMEEQVGIVREGAEIEKALEGLRNLEERAGKTRVEGHRQFNPGWHLAIDLRNLLTISTAIATCALNRKESRGGHTREDFPDSNEEWEKTNSVVREKNGEISLENATRSEMPEELQQLLTFYPKERGSDDRSNR